MASRTASGTPAQNGPSVRATIRPLPLALVCGAALFLGATVLAVAGARHLGQQVSDAGQTTSTALRHVTIGGDTLALPSNVIRFAAQRRDGPANGVDLYFRWPGLEGYTAGNRAFFNGEAEDEEGTLIFVSLSRRIMSQDMSGRYAPIYSQMIRSEAAPGPVGLLEFDLSDAAGYAGERLFVEDTAHGLPYVARCLSDDGIATPFRGQTSTACQRDIVVGETIAALYRFPESLLPEWEGLETAIRLYIEDARAGGPQSAS